MKRTPARKAKVSRREFLRTTGAAGLGVATVGALAPAAELLARASEAESPPAGPRLHVTRLADPISELGPSYELVIIGSGYGGSVTAARLASAFPRGSVCVLER